MSNGENVSETYFLANFGHVGCTGIKGLVEITREDDVLLTMLHRLEVLDDIFSKVASGICVGSALDAEHALLLVECRSTGFVGWTRTYLVRGDNI